MLTFDIVSLLEYANYKMPGHYFDRLYDINKWKYNFTLFPFMVAIYGRPHMVRDIYNKLIRVPDSLKHTMPSAICTIAYYASISGYLNIVKWAYKYKTGIMCNMIWRGHITSIKWAIANNVPSYSNDIVYYAAYYNNLEVLIHFRSEIDDPVKLIKNANVDTSKWLTDNILN